MPRPKKPGSGEPKTRSRHGCWPCKHRKIKCGEEKPGCHNCDKNGEKCDYSIHLNWEGRNKSGGHGANMLGTSSFSMYDTSNQPQAVQPQSRKRAAPDEGINSQYRTGQPVQHSASDNSCRENSGARDDRLEVESHTPIMKDSPTHDGRRPTSKQPNRPFESTPDANSFHLSGVGIPSTATHETFFRTNDNSHLQPPSANPRSSSRATPDSPFSPFGGPNHSGLDPNPERILDGVQNLNSRLLSAIKRPQDTQSASLLLQRRNGNGTPPDLSSWRVETGSPSVDPRYGTSSPYGHNLESYPSPLGSGIPSPANQPLYQHNTEGARPLQANHHMPPPLSSPSQYYTLANRPLGDQQRAFTGDHRSKKFRMEPDELTDHANIGKNTYQQYAQQPSQQKRLLYARGSHPESPPGGDPRFPPTPAASAASEEFSVSFGKSSPQYPETSYRDRKMSVQSLLSTPTPGDSGSEGAFPGHLNVSGNNSFGKVFHGIDRGRIDLDIPKNGDYLALQDKNDTLAAISPFITGADDDFELPAEFAFGLETSNELTDQAGYYSKPVQVYIPRSLEPLPTELLDNPMNMLYFHHFLDHTARNLVPIDCGENPFRTILPKMAVADTTLLHLLLTYSACHRARLLNHPEPTGRIAEWMDDVYQVLIEATQPNRFISDTSLASAIMMASLEIIAPGSLTSVVRMPWQQYVEMARAMIMLRGQGRPVHRHETTAYFLTRWLAYLDVMGSLSGHQSADNLPLFPRNYWAHDGQDEDHDSRVDCMMGFTSRCLSILANVAELAHHCIAERRDAKGNVRETWKPSAGIATRAKGLLSEIQRSRMQRYQGCPHRRSSVAASTDSNANSIELHVTNQLYHLAGQLHIHRRILGKPATSPDVQTLVTEIVIQLSSISEGGTAEACLLFPMFTAGCNALEGSHRDAILAGLKRVEVSGMCQVRQAREKVEEVWRTGQSWETFSNREFIG